MESKTHNFPLYFGPATNDYYYSITRQWNGSDRHGRRGQSVLAYLGDQLLERLELLLVDELELLDKVVVVLEQGVGVRLRLDLR